MPTVSWRLLRLTAMTVLDHVIFDETSPTGAVIERFNIPPNTAMFSRGVAWASEQKLSSALHARLRWYHKIMEGVGRHVDMYDQSMDSSRGNRDATSFHPRNLELCGVGTHELGFLAGWVGGRDGLFLCGCWEVHGVLKCMEIGFERILGGEVGICYDWWWGLVWEFSSLVPSSRYVLYSILIIPLGLKKLSWRLR